MDEKTTGELVAGAAQQELPVWREVAPLVPRASSRQKACRLFPPSPCWRGREGVSPRQRDGRAQPETVPLQELELWGRVLLENLNRAPRVGSNQHCQRFICRRWLRHPRDGMNGRNLVHHDQVRCERMEGVYVPYLHVILRTCHYSDEWTSSIGHREETTIGTQGEMRDGEEHVLLEQLRKVDFSSVINPLGIPSPDSELHASSSE